MTKTPKDTRTPVVRKAITEIMGKRPLELREKEIRSDLLPDLNAGVLDLELRLWGETGILKEAFVAMQEHPRIDELTMNRVGEWSGSGFIRLSATRGNVDTFNRYGKGTSRVAMFKLEYHPEVFGKANYLEWEFAYTLKKDKK